MIVNNTASKDKKVGVNFVAPVLDRLTSALQQILIYGLVLTGLMVVAVIGMSGYQYSLETKLQGINKEIEASAGELEKTTDFEYEFLATQEKLALYKGLNADEKMADLFPKLSALIPEGIQLQDLIIQPDRVEIVSYAANETSVAQFANNLKLANNSSFEDGQKLTVGNPNVREIAKSSGQVMSSGSGYAFSLSFNYSIE